MVEGQAARCHSKGLHIVQVARIGGIAVWCLVDKSVCRALVCTVGLFFYRGVVVRVGIVVGGCRGEDLFVSRVGWWTVEYLVLGRVFSFVFPFLLIHFLRMFNLWGSGRAYGWD